MTAPHTSVSPAPPREDPAERRRRRLAALTFRNMVLSVLGVLAIALVWWSITPSPTEPPRQRVEIPMTSAYAAEQADWPVWVAEPAGWTPTVARYESTEKVPTWHMSWVTAGGRYVAIDQAADVTDEWREVVLRGAREDGTVELAGPGGTGTWQRWAGERDSNAQVGYLLGPDRTGGSTVVLHGTGTQAEFEEFLAAVEPRD